MLSLTHRDNASAEIALAPPELVDLNSILAGNIPASQPEFYWWLGLSWTVLAAISLAVVILP